MNAKDPECAGWSRRGFMAAAGALGAAAAIPLAGRPQAEAAAFGLPPLPWADNALEPVISANTVGYHYGKHHKGYVDNLNRLAADTEWAGADLEAVVRGTSGKPDLSALFNNAAQVWNHTFFWRSLKPGGGGAPSGRMAEALAAAFGSYETFRKEFLAAAAGQFGSGWAWLAAGESGLAVVKTPNAETPLTRGLKPLLTLDVWEHAYYLDYQNRRADYAAAVTDRLLNWDFALENLGRA
jgi:Fe-Mn family superoxide dismutase